LGFTSAPIIPPTPIQSNSVAAGLGLEVDLLPASPPRQNKASRGDWRPARLLDLAGHQRATSLFPLGEAVELVQSPLVRGRFHKIQIGVFSHYMETLVTKFRDAIDATPSFMDK
jgi:hypothetical protein